MGCSDLENNWWYYPRPEVYISRGDGLDVFNAPKGTLIYEIGSE